jgi:hypothetical protein
MKCSSERVAGWHSVTGRISRLDYGIVNALVLVMENREMDLNNQNAEPRIDFGKLGLSARSGFDHVGPNGPLHNRLNASGPPFTSAEMRHNFAIWALDHNEDHKQRRRHLYFCVRCEQAFSVDDRDGSATPLDSRGSPIEAREAARRLKTFSCGPCPAFSRLTRPRFRSKVTPIRAAGRRSTSLASACHRAWKSVLLALASIAGDRSEPSES